MRHLPFDVVIVGGGPAAAAEAIRSSRRVRRVAVVSDGYGGCMRMLANQRMQSYIPELDIADGTRRLAAYVQGLERTSPTGREFATYVFHLIRDVPIAHVTGNVIGIERCGRDFAVELQGPSGFAVLKAAEVILATGLTPRDPGAWAPPGKTVTCFQAYHEIGLEQTARYAGRDVAIIGSGNSAFQLAASVARMARSVVVLAISYVGLYPQETNDRFGLRAPTQQTLEMIAKTAARDCLGPLNARSAECIAPIWLHVYEQLTWHPRERCLTAFVRLGDNTARVPAISCALARSAGRLRKCEGADDRYCIKLAGENLTVISAIGVKARVPETAWNKLVEPDSRFVRHEHGRTEIDGLYVAGGCAGYPSVNMMQSPARTSECPMPQLEANAGGDAAFRTMGLPGAH
jgi:thioredoxin reductase